MNCETARQQLGAYADGELPPERAADIQRHAEGGPACAAEVRELNEIIGQLADTPAPQVPSELWSMIESRLDGTPSHRTIRGPASWLRRPVMAAASIAILIGAGVFLASWLGSGTPVARADDINFAVLLDGLATDVDSAFGRFLQYHQAEPIAARAARAAAPELRFAVPAELPGGFRLQQAYRFRLGTQTGIAARYTHERQPLIVFFHRPTNKEHFGIRTEMSCLVEGREVHSVEVGPWRLAHFTDPTTCHCVLSTLDVEKELPAVFAAIAPGFKAGGNGGGH
jgi:hypothetical protein